MQEGLLRRNRGSNKGSDKWDCFLLQGVKLCMTQLTNTLMGAQAFVGSVGGNGVDGYLLLGVSIG